LTFGLDHQSRPSDGANVFRVNLAQIRSAVPEIFHTQQKTQTDGAKNRTFRSSLRAVKTTMRLTYLNVLEHTFDDLYFYFIFAVLELRLTQL